MDRPMKAQTREERFEIVLDTFRNGYGLTNLERTMICEGLDEIRAALSEKTAQVEKSQKAHEEIASICFRHGIDTPDGSSVGAVKSMAEAFAICSAQRDRTLEAVEKLREAAGKAHRISTGEDDGDDGEDAEDALREIDAILAPFVALTATEPELIYKMATKIFTSEEELEAEVSRHIQNKPDTMHREGEI